MIILGHRGIRGSIENTLPAFRRALKYADGIEFDVRATRDGKLVVHHDETFRGNGSVYRIRDLTLRELRKLHPFGRLIPTVGEILRAFPDAFLDFDLKGPETLDGILKLSKRFRTFERAVYSSENPLVLKALLRECPECRVGLSIVGYSSLKWLLSLKTYSVHVPLDAVSYVGYSSLVTMLRAVRKRGLRVFLWNYQMNELVWVPRLAHLSDGIISDDPARLLRTFSLLENGLKTDPLDDLNRMIGGR